MYIYTLLIYNKQQQTTTGPASGKPMQTLGPVGRMAAQPAGQPAIGGTWSQNGGAWRERERA
eukprot:3101404-Heterocapsa_arctica.AAC.1